MRGGMCFVLMVGFPFEETKEKVLGGHLLSECACVRFHFSLCGKLIRNTWCSMIYLQGLCVGELNYHRLVVAGRNRGQERELIRFICESTFEGRWSTIISFV